MAIMLFGGCLKIEVLYKFRLGCNDREETAVPCPYSRLIAQETALPCPDFYARLIAQETALPCPDFG
ncbi:hypothetical protein QT972_17665 [Microcoleus sp. herbarium7]|uniref:hypothetical protein n=1 Tax=Microcoleus sp. herbarium7 TaxID=3055435 RepID=UPI002FD2F312